MHAFVISVQQSSTRTEHEEFVHKITDYQPVIPPPSEEEFPSLKVVPGPSVKSAWGKGPPKINKSIPSEPPQRYPPNHQTPSQYLQHKAQTQRHAYGVVPRQPFPQQYGPHGDTVTYGQAMRPQGMALRGPSQSPQSGPPQTVPRGPSPAVQGVPFQSSMSGPPNHAHGQVTSESTLNADWANRIQETVANSIPQTESAFPGAEDIALNKTLAAFVVSQSKSFFFLKPVISLK